MKYVDIEVSAEDGLINYRRAKAEKEEAKRQEKLAKATAKAQIQALVE